MALLFTLPRSNQFDAVGLLMSGWTVEFYSTATSTPRTVYADAALTVELGSSVTTGDDGSLRPIYLDDSGAAYKIVIKDANGEVVPNGTIDPYLIGPSQNQIGRALYPRTQAEQAASVAPVNYFLPPGDPERYQTNSTPGTTNMLSGLVAANAQASQVGGLPIVCSSVLHIPTEIAITGRFETPRIHCFTTASEIVFGAGTVDAVLPEWWGAVGDAEVDTGSGTNCTAAFQAAITASTEDGDDAVAIHQIHVAPGNYLVGNLTFPPATAFRGCGRHTTNFVVATGTTGKWFTDTGSAAKIIMEDFAMYGRSLTALTHGLQLGHNGTQHGVEGYVRNIWVQDVPEGTLIDINGNVGFYQGLAAYTGEHGIAITGIANHASELVCYGCTATGADLNLVDVNGLEVEAPGNDCVPVYLRGNATIDGLVISLTSGAVISHLVELAAAATTWKIDGFNLAFGAPFDITTVTNGNFKRADGTYFGGNATAGSRNGEGNYSSSSAGQRLQSFVLRIVNTAGTMQHRISDASESGAAGNFAACIGGASPTLANTPTGTDGSTAFVSGGKIGSATPSIFWLDTASQKIADGLFIAHIVYNDTDTALNVTPVCQSIDINGVTRTRLGFQLTNAATGATFGITTSNFDSGEMVKILFYGYLAQ